MNNDFRFNVQRSLHGLLSVAFIFSIKMMWPRTSPNKSGEPQPLAHSEVPNEDTLNIWIPSGFRAN